MKTKKIVTLASLLSIGVLASCSADDSVTPVPAPESDSASESGGTENTSESSEETTTTNDDTAGSGPGIENMTFEISVYDAIDTYNETFPDTMIESIYFDEDDGRFEYEFDGFDSNNEYELTIDATTGDILDQEQDDDDDNDDDPLDLDGIIPPEEAFEVALNESGDGYVDDWELDVKSGVTVYEIDLEGVSGDDDFIVDAHTGEFLGRD